MKSYITISVHTVAEALNEVIFLNNGSITYKNGFAKIVGPGGGVSLSVNTKLFWYENHNKNI